MLKKFFLAILGMGCLTVNISAGEIPYEDRAIAAIMPFSYNVEEYPQYQKSVSGLADSLAVDLLKTNKIRLIERSRIDAALKEISLGQAGVVDSATASRAGKQLGAQQVILGSIVALSIREEGRSVLIATKTNRWVEIEAEAHIIDVETGEMLAAGKAINKVNSAEKHAFGGKIGKLASEESLVQQAMLGLGEKLAKDLAKNIRPKKK